MWLASPAVQARRRLPQIAQNSRYTFTKVAPMFTEALECRLKVIEEEILRLTNLASQTPKKDQQENHWLMAKDLQREAQAIRTQIAKSSIARSLEDSHRTCAAPS
jgi:hypothetical protein